MASALAVASGVTFAIRARPDVEARTSPSLSAMVSMVIQMIRVWASSAQTDEVRMEPKSFTYISRFFSVIGLVLVSAASFVLSFATRNTCAFRYLESALGFKPASFFALAVTVMMNSDPDAVMYDLGPTVAVTFVVVFGAPAIGARWWRGVWWAFSTACSSNVVAHFIYPHH